MRDAKMESIATLMADAARTMAAPRRIKRDERGKAIGVEVAQ
jgi:hypothetical protein